MEEITVFRSLGTRNDKLRGVFTMHRYTHTAIRPRI